MSFISVGGARVCEYGCAPFFWYKNAIFVEQKQKRQQKWKVWIKLFIKSEKNFLCTLSIGIVSTSPATNNGIISSRVPPQITNSTVRKINNGYTQRSFSFTEPIHPIDMVISIQYFPSAWHLFDSLRAHWHKRRNTHILSNNLLQKKKQERTQQQQHQKMATAM